MTQHITLAEVKSACQKAYKEKRLIAQNVQEVGADYGYCLLDKYVCAIGAALTSETLSDIDTYHAQEELIGKRGNLPYVT